MFSRTKKDNVHGLIMEQFQVVKSCLSCFEDFMRVTSSAENDQDTLRSICELVYAKEHEADVALRKMIESLGGTMYLPSTREDLIAIGTSCDKIANKCEDISYMVVLQNFRFPEDYNDDIREIMSLTNKQFELLEEAIKLLFTRMNDLLKNYTILNEIRDYESRIDVYERKLYEKSYSLDIGLAERMRLTEFVSSLCDISDIIENVADQIQIMVVTRKA